MFRLALQEDGKRASTASMMRALKDALLCVLRCRAPQALTWHRKVAASLEALGAGEAAEAEVRRAERQVCLLCRRVLLRNAGQAQLWKSGLPGRLICCMSYHPMPESFLYVSLKFP